MARHDLIRCFWLLETHTCLGPTRVVGLLLEFGSGCIDILFARVGRLT